MNNENRVLWAQILGLVAIVLARFGIDISAEEQTNMLAGLSAFGLVLTAVLAKVRAGSSGSVGRESGRALPGLLLVLGVSALLLVSIQGCTNMNLTPRHTIAATSAVVEDMGEQVNLAQKTGQISEARKIALIDQLAAINKDLRLALSLTGDAQQFDLSAINQRLTDLRLELAKETHQSPQELPDGHSHR